VGAVINQLLAQVEVFVFQTANIEYWSIFSKSRNKFDHFGTLQTKPQARTAQMVIKTINRTNIKQTILSYFRLNEIVYTVIFTNNKLVKLWSTTPTLHITSVLWLQNFLPFSSDLHLLFAASLVC